MPLTQVENITFRVGPGHGCANGKSRHFTFQTASIREISSFHPSVLFAHLFNILTVTDINNGRITSVTLACKDSFLYNSKINVLFQAASKQF